MCACVDVAKWDSKKTLLPQCALNGFILRLLCWHFIHMHKKVQHCVLIDKTAVDHIMLVYQSKVPYRPGMTWSERKLYCSEK